MHEGARSEELQLVDFGVGEFDPIGLGGGDGFFIGG